ncbi:dihydroxyacetone kinase subunit DhaL [Mycoplasma putrefaciens]|uniref:Dihydroxyacetone kinase n=1 Tax=Mycoplasma putrefaciens Mput9231 TaxID=1292033 RepID=M9WI92_9MOLU|nr:dihydroxyacetone kinase subunit DhaL [Mycoplasma putrefaciens]AGJ91089.1 Dihydroxyacetone kinase [Mycoplasma putrefaciens Mput9231]
MSVDIKKVTNILIKISDKIEQNKQYLSQLDALIGDADHGHNLTKGFLKIKEDLQTNSYADLASLFKSSGMLLVSNVGGASGPLYGTAFLKASTVLVDKQEIDINDFSNCLIQAVEGIKLRGKAQLNDKTILDVLIPVSELIQELIKTRLDAKEILTKAVDLAYKQALYTKTIIAKKGRASYLGQRSIDHIDPGCWSAFLILETIKENI